MALNPYDKHILTLTPNAEDISAAIHNYLAAQEESRALESAFKEQSISCVLQTI